MEGLAAGDLRIEVADGGGRGPIQLFWAGKSADRYPVRILSPYFATVLGTAAKRQMAVEQHFEKLEHFNSATITAIIQLIQDARAAGVKLTLVYDQKLRWQKLSFDALRVFEKGDDFLTIRSA